MSNVENMIIEHLKAIRADVSTIKEDAREIKTRLALKPGSVASSATALNNTAISRRNMCATTVLRNESKKSKNAWN